MGAALITGASSGLGLELARLFAADNLPVILVARRQARLEAIAEVLRTQGAGVRVDVLPLDLATPGAGATLFQQVQQLGVEVDFLVNNAGFGGVGTIRDIPIDRQLQMVDLNVRTMVELTRLMLPSMVQRRRGRILNVGS